MKIKTHTIVLAVAPSQAGKSFFIAKTIEDLSARYPEYRFKTVSSDENRRFLLGKDLHKHDPKMMPVSKQAFDLLYNQLDALTSYPVNTEVVFVDSTHISAPSRNKILQIAEKNNYNVAYVLFKYDDRDNYYKFIDEKTNKKVISDHVQRFFKETVKTLNGTHNKLIVRDHDFDDYKIEIEDYEENLRYKLDSNDYIVVSDIHGCHDKLQKVLDLNPSRNVIVLGDILDKNTKENIEKTIDLVYEGVNSGRIKFVIGNHDIPLVSFHKGEKRYTKDIIKEYFPSFFLVSEEHKEKMVKIVENGYPYIETPHYILTHAPCEDKYVKLHSAKEMRTYRYPKQDEYSSREEWSEDVLKKVDGVFSKEYHLKTRVVGHIALEKPIWGANYLMIDTGAYTGNALTYLDLSKRGKEKFKKIGEYTDRPDLVIKKIVQEKKQTLNLLQLHPRDRGRILYAAKNGLPLTSSTVCPADQFEDSLESLTWALNYYDGDVVLQQKYMGSWACIRLRQKPEECKTFSRNGYLIKKPELLPAYQPLIDKLPWDNVKEYVIGAELMPWRFLGDSLIDKAFYGLNYLVDNKIKALKSYGFEKALEQLINADFPVEKKEAIEKMGHHSWATKQARDGVILENYNDLELLAQENDKFRHQIDLFGQEGEPWFESFVCYKIVYKGGKEEIKAENNEWVYANNLNDNLYCSIDKDNPSYIQDAYEFFNLVSNEEKEGVVVKPVKPEKGKAPMLKVRNPEYLRLAYGFDYPLHLDFHKNKKNIKRKLDQSIVDWKRGLDILSIPVEELREENEELLAKYADFVVGEKAMENVDPRL